MQNPDDYRIILFYKFIHIADKQGLANVQREKCLELGLTGRLIIASEGINATFEGRRDAIDAYKEFLKNDSRFSDIKIKESKGNGLAFPKLKIKIRSEVVTLGAGSFDIKNDTARELRAKELEKWYENNEDFVVLDLRNDYEIASGRFEKTIDLRLGNFRDLPKRLEDLKSLKNKKIVTVCTGGIRCEKATCLLKKEGFTDIYQLKDGIHTYMEQYPGKNFKGSLFVFDNRLTTDVVEMENKVVVGKCLFCEETCEKYYSDNRIRPSRKIISCDACYIKNQSFLRKAVTTGKE